VAHSLNGYGKYFFFKPVFDYFFKIGSNDFFLIAHEIAHLFIYNTFCHENYVLEDIER